MPTAETTTRLQEHQKELEKAKSKFDRAMVGLGEMENRAGDLENETGIVKNKLASVMSEKSATEVIQVDVIKCVLFTKLSTMCSP